ncbi:MAG TPA: IPT/TIG domain-containing protein, partial [Geobacteraceae bacterium]|nr:IPT/TIG domain-containing protein [Geobacteraceae bacterium]
AAVALSGCGDGSAPSITGFSPAGGAVGTTVTITGANFDPTAANDAVSFNGTAAVISSASGTQLVASVPAGATTGPISVTVLGQTVSSSTNFIIPPTITGVSPAGGPVGTTVTITGTGFDVTSANNTVMFNGTAAVVTSSTGTNIVTYVPMGATTGPVTVTVAGQTATSPTIFTVN